MCVCVCVCVCVFVCVYVRELLDWIYCITCTCVYRVLVLGIKHWCVEEWEVKKVCNRIEKDVLNLFYHMEVC